MREFIGFTRIIAWVALFAVVLVGGLRLTVIRWVRVPSDDTILSTSILPTLAGGDLVLLTRITKPTFGDLVLCPEPNYPERFVIGRILGEAGDEVHLKDGDVDVNGKHFLFERNCDPTEFTYAHPDRPSEEVTQVCEWEVIANHLHKTGAAGGHKARTFEQKYVVPEGQWFLLSDNRLFPYDSRDFGFVDKSTCKETVTLRLTSAAGWKDSENRMTFIQ